MRAFLKFCNDFHARLEELLPPKLTSLRHLLPCSVPISCILINDAPVRSTVAKLFRLDRDPARRDRLPVLHLLAD